MNEVLSQDEIDQLLMAISSGESESEDFKPVNDTRKIKIYDFRRPDKFSKEQMRTIQIMHETFARLTTTSLFIGYPSFTDEGLQVVCFFNPELQIGGTIKIDTIVPKAKGTWKITEFSHELEVNDSSSATWRSSFNAVYVGD